MGKVHKPKEIPADKIAENLPPERAPNAFTKLAQVKKRWDEKRAAQEDAMDSASEEVDKKVWKWYRKTPMGKAWVRWRNRLRKTRRGRVILGGVYLSISAFWLSLLFLYGPVVDWIFGTNEGRIELTATQQQDGYSEGCSGKRCSFKDGAAWRFMTPAEQAADPECKPDSEDCLSVIPLEVKCEYITVMILKYIHSGDWFSDETVFQDKYPVGSKNWSTGKPLTFSISDLGSQHEEWSIDQVRCSYE
jgi:hypothetical protein